MAHKSLDVLKIGINLNVTHQTKRFMKWKKKKWIFTEKYEGGEIIGLVLQSFMAVQFEFS